MFLKLFAMLHTTLASFTSPVYYDSNEYQYNLYNASEVANMSMQLTVYDVFSTTRCV